MLSKINEFKNKRNILLLLQSYLSNSLTKSQDSLNLPYTKKMNIIIPYCGNKIENPYYVAEEDLHLVDDKKNIFFLKSFISKNPKTLVLNNVWIKLENKASIDIQDYYDNDVIKAEAVSVFEEIFDLNKSSPIKRGSFVLDTSDVVPYIKTSFFRLLNDLVSGMKDHESREIDLPIILNSNTSSENKLSITKISDNMFKYEIINSTRNENISGGPVILPKVAEAVINTLGWYDQLDDKLLPEWFMSNKELLQSIQQILLDIKNSFAVSSINSISKEIENSDLSEDKLKEILEDVRILKEEVVGTKSKINKLATLSDTEIDNINNIINNIQDLLSNSSSSKIININVK